MTESKYNRYKHTTFQSEVLDKIIFNPITGCNEFNGPKNESGYGRIAFKGKKIYIHREIYKKFKGEIPNNMVVRHFVCDNPPCCTVGHLELGTNQDNIKDKIIKGRQSTGTKIPQAKLNEEKVLEIRKLNAEGMKQKDIAKLYGIDNSQVSRVVNRIDWKWL
jgi:hypothetical protein